MITFLGIIIFTIPFTSLFLFKDKVIGFFSILTMSFFVHMLIALTTQSLHLFEYWIILTIYSLISLGVGVFVYLKIKNNHHHTRVGYAHLLRKAMMSGKKIISKQNLLITIAFAVILLNLASVHYNFTGVVNSHVGPSNVENSLYPYPYFSDEWVGVAFVNYTIGSHSLPVVNPLLESQSFKNPLVPYFSFLSDIFLFFGLNPLNDFEFVNLLVGLLTCISFFALLISLGVDKRVSALSVLIIPYITNGGNLPGIWFLIPMTFALPFYVISLIGFAKGNNKLFAISSLFTLCLYPAFIVFVVPIWIALIIKNDGAKVKAIVHIILLSILALVIVGSLVFNSINPLAILDTLRFYFFRTNLVGGYLSFPIWFVLPIFVMPFALFGIFLAIRKRLYFILLPLFTGLVFWLCYVRAYRVLIIDYPRVVTITSFLILIFFGFSLNYLVKRFINEKLKNILTAMCILVAIQLSFTYTQNDSWKDLMLHSNNDPEGVMLRPAPTASGFLTEDLTLFSSFTKKTFISPPWKGLVLSAATGNYPMTSKPSTVGVFVLNYDWFANTKCEEKDIVSIDHNISYAYSKRFYCPNFIEVGESSEGLVLYKFSKVK